MAISGRQQNPSSNYGQATLSTMTIYPAPPPPYSAVTGGKHQPVSLPQQRGEISFSMITDGAAPVQGMSLPEAPPAYENIQSTAH